MENGFDLFGSELQTEVVSTKKTSEELSLMCEAVQVIRIKKGVMTTHREIIDTIKNLLKLTKSQEFFDSVSWGDGENVSVEVSPKISFLISGCEC
jgi:hypothetical protein